MPEKKLEIWHGYKATATNFEMGYNLVIDSLVKFMSTEKALSILTENNCSDIKALEKLNDRDYDNLVKIMDSYSGEHVTTTYGTKKTYTLKKFDLEKCAATEKLDMDDGSKSITIQQYFKKTYNLTLKFPNAPLLMCEHRKKNIYLPAECCKLESLPKSLTSNSFAMRELLQSVRTNPNQKMDKLTDFVRWFCTAESFKNWGVKISSTPQSLKTRVLATPMLTQGMGSCEERSLRKTSILNSVHLKRDKWVFVYENRDYDIAFKVYTALSQCCKQLGTTVEEPFWIELKQCRFEKDFDRELTGYCTKNGSP
jgi:hypothetical protein